MLKNDVFSYTNQGMKGLKKEFLQQGGVILFFIVLSLVFFSPVLQGKGLDQFDIGQYKGMAKERNDYKEKTGIESYWTNNAFGGMPTYQLGANYPHNYIKRLDRLIRFLPRPADYLFLYLLSFYIFMISLKVEWKWAILGAIAYGFSTYLLIILEAGHNAKAHALGYAPLVLAGLVWIFRKRYFWGGLVFILGMALEITANHYQMTYYLMLLIGVFVIIKAYQSFRQKKGKEFGLQLAILIFGMLVAIGTDAAGIMATKEYADWSTRGKSELSLTPAGLPKESQSGLSKEYITHWSYGITESMNLFVPRLFGGGSREPLGRDSESYRFLVDAGYGHRQALQISEGLPLYWGDQPGVAAPAYVGAVIFFLFILALFNVRGPYRWWLGLGALFSLLLSWGKNFGFLTNLMIDYFPLYDKFRAVSSIQVILELCVPALAILGVYQFFKGNLGAEQKKKSLLWAGGISAGSCLLLLILKGSFSFESINDEGMSPEFLAMLIEDRRKVFSADLWRSFILISLTFGVLWYSLKQKLREIVILGALAGLLLFDLYGVANRYFTQDDFISKRRIENPFMISEADKQIQRDKGYYRVFDLNEGLSGARTNYFHKSIGGYHAAKPASLEELFEYQVYQGNDKVIDMLNVKYFIQRGEDGKRIAQQNPAAFGNAWFVDTLRLEPSADAVMQRMKSSNLRSTALAVKEETLAKNAGIRDLNTFRVDSIAKAELVSYKPNELAFSSSNAEEGILVFSDLYYPQGWKALIDGKEVPILKVNHALRALSVPAGQHNITFSFEPEVVKKGSTISLISFLFLLILTLYGLGQNFLPKKYQMPIWLLNSKDA